jgi:hypothetical protein
MNKFNVGDLVEIKTEGLKDAVGIVLDRHSLLYSVKDLEVPIYRVHINHNHMYVKQNLLNLITKGGIT